MRDAGLAEENAWPVCAAFAGRCMAAFGRVVNRVNERVLSGTLEEDDAGLFKAACSVSCSGSCSVSCSTARSTRRPERSLRPSRGIVVVAGIRAAAVPLAARIAPPTSTTRGHVAVADMVRKRGAGALEERKSASGSSTVSTPTTAATAAAATTAASSSSVHRSVHRSWVDRWNGGWSRLGGRSCRSRSNGSHRPRCRG